jgi:cold-inducible RNA-binding protein
LLLPTALQITNQEEVMKVYIGNIADMSYTQFSEMVNPFGTPNTANIPMDRATGMSRGFGFVEYPNDQHAQAAIAGLNGKEVNGHVLKVNESRPKI